MAIKNREPSRLWKSRDQVTTTFHQFNLCSLNTLHFLQVSAFLLRVVRTRGTPQSLHRSGHHPSWWWVEAGRQHPHIYSGNNPKQIPWVSVWWLYFYGNYEARHFLNVYVNIRGKNKTANSGKTSILQIQYEVYWNTLTYSSENYILGWSNYELIPAQVSSHGFSYCKCITWLWRELLKWKIKLYIKKSANIFF